MRWYYLVWVDCITKGKANNKNWPLISLVSISISMGLNFAVFMSVLQRDILGFYFYELELSFLPEYINNGVSFITLFLLPFVVINYVLIFKNNRYKKLLKKYPYKNGKLFLIYFLISMFLPLTLVLMEAWFF